MNRYEANRLTERMTTVCLGRFLVDLPAAAVYRHTPAYIDGFWISGIEETGAAFASRVAARAAEIDAEPNAIGNKNMESAEPVEIGGLSGKIFIFGRRMTRGIEHGLPVEWWNLKIEGYLHGSGKSFNFRNDGYPIHRTGHLRELMKQLRIVEPGEIPSAPGFCFGPGMLLDPLTPEQTEGVRIFASLPGAPDLAITFNTRAGLKNPGRPGRLVRHAMMHAERPLWRKAMVAQLRVGKRTLAGIEGDEVIECGTEPTLVDVYAFDWEVVGTTDDVRRPTMHLEMSTGHSPSRKVVPASLSQEALFQLWDKIAGSTRLRPTSAAN